MNTAPAEAARLRLQHLHTVFLHIRTPGQLTEAMAEAGSIYFDLMQLGLVPSSDHLQELGSIGRLNAGRVQTGDVADHAYQVVWQMAADMFSSRLRLLLRPVPDAEVPVWTIYHSTQAPDQAEPIVTRETLPSTGTVHTTNWQQDYAEQGQRYALFVSEVLAELQHGTPQVVEVQSQVVEVQPQAGNKTKSSRKRTDPQQHVNKLRQKMQNGYTYPGNYPKLVEDIGGSVGTWTNIFADPENADLLAWKENRSICARNSPAAEQAAYEDEPYLPDEDIEKLFADQVKELPKGKQQQAWEQFRNMPLELQRKYIAGSRS